MRIPMNGRPLMAAKQHMEKLRSERAVRQMDAEAKLAAFDEAVEVAKDKVPAPMIEVFRQMMLQALSVPSFPPLPETDEEFEAAALSQAAYQYAGVYLEGQPCGGFKMWDIEGIVAEARGILYDGSVAYIDFGQDLEPLKLEGRAARQLKKYLDYLGIFAAVKIRVPCLNCSGANTMCEVCGGLGWVPDPSVLKEKS